MPEGQLLILRLGIASSETKADYSISFSWSRLGSTPTADRRCHGDSALRAFLNDVGIRADQVDTAIRALRTSTEHRILHVYLTLEWLTQLELSATEFARAVFCLGKTQTCASTIRCRLPNLTPL